MFAGTGQALTITYDDIYANWPGYPQPPYPVNPADQIGSFPTITGASITISDAGVLESIVMNITNLRWTEVLFVQTDWDKAGGEPYDHWDFIVTSGADIMAVNPAFTPNDYILVTGPDYWRIGHPYSINPSMLTKVGEVTRVIGSGTLAFNFNKGYAPTMGENFVFGMSMDCANDVFLTPVPEPTSLLFLGLGLLGVYGGVRRFKKKI